MKSTLPLVDLAKNIVHSKTSKATLENQPYGIN